MDLIEIAALSMRSDSERLNIIANNLANAATPGYKRAIAVQERSFDAAMQRVVDDTLSGQPPALKAVHDPSPGALRPTGRSLDITVGPNAFLELRTEAGGLVYGRGGSFQVDAQGQVRLAGARLQLLDGDFRLTGSEQELGIDGSGAVAVGERRIGQLRLVRFDAASRMKPIGSGLYEAGTARLLQDQAPAGVRAGFVEASNVQPSREMVRLMETTRHFEAMHKVVQAYDESLASGVRKLGEF